MNYFLFDQHTDLFPSWAHVVLIYRWMTLSPGSYTPPRHHSKSQQTTLITETAYYRYLIMYC